MSGEPPSYFHPVGPLQCHIMVVHTCRCETCILSKGINRDDSIQKNNSVLYSIMYGLNVEDGKDTLPRSTLRKEFRMSSSHQINEIHN